MNYGPSSSEYINQLANKILDPIKKGESVFVRWFPGHGKTVILSKIILDKKLLSKHLGLFYERFIFIKIDGCLFSTSDLQNFFFYVLNSLIDKLKNKKIHIDRKINNTAITPLILTVKRIINLCQNTIEKGYEIIFIIDAIDELSDDLLKQMFTVWELILESNRERIHTHINVNRRSIIENLVTQSGLIQNIIQVALPDIKECRYFANYYLKEWKIRFSR